MYVCMYVCTCSCMPVSLCVHISFRTFDVHVCKYGCMHACLELFVRPRGYVLCVRLYVCVFVCVCVRARSYAHMYTWGKLTAFYGRD